MSSSFLSQAAARTEDASLAAATTAPSGRQKIAVLSDKVVDSNPYSRLMCVLAGRAPALAL